MDKTYVIMQKSGEEEGDHWQVIKHVITVGEL